MILKGNARGNSIDLAIHLLNEFDNEFVDVAEIRGTIAPDLYGALAEYEAIASGTKAEKPTYSLSISPSEQMTHEQYFEVIDAAEKKLGLHGQPRAVVFHVKDGREHCHVAWSRIDALQMKAIHMAHDHRRLMDVAVVFAEKYGHELPKGLKAWKKREAYKREMLDTSLHENAAQKKTGISAEERRAEITEAYLSADSAEGVKNALEEKGYVLAQGDRRAFVVVDKFGDVHSLSRYVKGVPRKSYRARMDGLDIHKLPSVPDAQEQQKAREKAAEERAREQDRKEQSREQRSGDDVATDELEKLKRLLAEKRASMDKAQATRRIDLAGKEQAVLVTQQQERMALHAAQKGEASGLFFRMRARVADLIAGSPALKSVIGQITARVELDPRERHQLENAALDARHAREQQAINGQRKALARVEAREQQSFERDLKREVAEQSARIDAERKKRAEQEQQQQKHRTDPRLLEEGALGQEFNTSADARRDDGGGDGDGSDDRSAGKSWKQRAQENGQKRSSGRGYSMRRDG